MTQQPKNKKSFAIVLLSIFLVISLPFAFVTLVYFIEIKPHADAEISTFTQSIRNITDPQTKIRVIANFTEEGYYQTYNKNSSSFWLLSSIWGFQVFDDPQKFRIRSHLLFANDPYFIAYFKTGACEESATLFNFVAEKSEFESRIVGTNAEDHRWNEVKINNSWVQVDPTIYYYYYTDPMTYPYADLWFNYPQAYTELGWYGGYSTVFVMDTREYLTTKYCNSSKLSISCQNCTWIKIKSDNGRRFSIDQEMRDSEATVNLGNKNYSILADKTLIPFLLVKEKNTTISLTGNENINITSFPEEIRLTVYSQILIIVGFFILVILSVLFAIGTIIGFYRKWKNKQDAGDTSNSKEI